jgi:hypothetical protein
MSEREVDSEDWEEGGRTRERETWKTAKRQNGKKVKR